MIVVQECVGTHENLEAFLSRMTAKFGWKVISIQKTWFWTDPFRTGWIVVYEIEG
jgi:hypothetical protein